MHLAPFLAIATVVVVTPGVDMALVTKNALLHGRGSALATALGVNVGIALWTVAAALGVAALVAASAALFAVVKLAGAVYLVTSACRHCLPPGEEPRPGRRALHRPVWAARCARGS